MQNHQIMEYRHNKTMYDMNHIVHNQYPDILQELMPIRFPCLIKIIVQGNNIESVEGLYEAFMPMMEELWLSKN